MSLPRTTPAATSSHVGDTRPFDFVQRRLRLSTERGSVGFEVARHLPVHSTGPTTFILLSTWVCSNPEFSSTTETCRLMKNNT